MRRVNYKFPVLSEARYYSFYDEPKAENKICVPTMQLHFTQMDGEVPRMFQLE